MVTSDIVSSRSAEINEREGVKKSVGVCGGVFHFSCCNRENQKDWRWIGGSLHLGPWLVESEGELLVTVDERRG